MELSALQGTADTVSQQSTCHVQEAYDRGAAEMISTARRLWEERGRVQAPGFYQPQFGDADWDETQFCIRVDAIEGDEEKRQEEAKFVFR